MWCAREWCNSSPDLRSTLRILNDPASTSTSMEVIVMKRLTLAPIKSRDGHMDLVTTLPITYSWVILNLSVCMMTLICLAADDDGVSSGRLVDNRGWTARTVVLDNWKHQLRVVQLIELEQLTRVFALVVHIVMVFREIEPGIILSVHASFFYFTYPCCRSTMESVRAIHFAPLSDEWGEN